MPPTPKLPHPSLPAAHGKPVASGPRRRRRPSLIMFLLLLHAKPPHLRSIVAEGSASPQHPRSPPPPCAPICVCPQPTSQGRPCQQAQRGQHHQEGESSAKASSSGDRMMWVRRFRAPSKARPPIKTPLHESRHRSHVEPSALSVATLCHAPCASASSVRSSKEGRKDQSPTSIERRRTPRSRQKKERGGRPDPSLCMIEVCWRVLAFSTSISSWVDYYYASASPTIIKAKTNNRFHMRGVCCGQSIDGDR